MSDNEMDYDAWRISFQSSESAARAAFSESAKLRARVAELEDECNGQHDLLIEHRTRTTALQARLNELEAENGALQAKLDRVMLEHCPDEMTDEQMQRWEQSQKVGEITAEVQRPL